MYAGRGLKDRLTHSSPPRNTAFGTISPHRQHPIHEDNQDAKKRGSSDETSSPMGGMSGILRSRTTIPQDAFAAFPSHGDTSGLPSQCQQDIMIPRLGQQGQRSSTGISPSRSQRSVLPNSPPRIGIRRRSSAGTRSGSTSAAGGRPEAVTPEGATGGAAGRRTSRRAQANACTAAIGGGMSLSRSLGALGQGGAAKPPPIAIVNTRDDGAPYLRSERMSPKSTVQGSGRFSPVGYSPR